MELRSLPREQVMEAWPKIEPVLSRIVGKDGREDLLDVAGALLKGEYHAMLVVDGDEIASVCIVQINQYRASKVAHIVYVAGKCLTEWLHFLDSLEGFCKAHGVTDVEGTGRRGWERLLKSHSYRVVSSTIRKRL